MNIPRLTEIASEVKRIQADYRNIIGRAAILARQMGELLFEARGMIQSRQWSKWLAQELDLTPDAAHRYITIHRQWKAIESHEAFPDLTIIQMFDVARGRTPRDKRSYKLGCQSLDVLLDMLDQRLAAACERFPWLEALIDAIDAARPKMEACGLLKSQVEARKKHVREQRRKGAA